MIVKTFIAESTNAALKRVRVEMGADAVVLRTRQLEGRGAMERVEITACLDKEAARPVAVAAPLAVPTATTRPVGRNRIRNFAPQNVTVARKAEAPLAEPTNDRLSLLEEKLDRLIHATQQATVDSPNQSTESELIQALHRADLTKELIAALTNGIYSNDDISARLTEHLSARVETNLTFKAGDRIMLVGLPGAGKSSVMGKLAAQLSFRERRQVSLVSLDDCKVGSLEEIESYGDLLGTETKAIEHWQRKRDDQLITLFDCPAAPFTGDRSVRMKKYLTAIEPTHVLAVVSALTRTSELEHFAEILAPVTASHVVLTMTDLTCRLGAAQVAPVALNARLAFTTNGPGGIGTLNQIDIENLKAILLGTEVKSE